MNKTEWKPWMLEHLRRFYATDTNRELQKTLGVGYLPMTNKAKELGLSKKSDGKYLPGERRSPDTEFKPGLTPWNKGKPGTTGYHPNTQATQFKKGRPAHEARNYLPIGSLRITRDGILERKVTDDPALVPARRWKPVTRLVWEEAHGPIPRGYVVRFKDGIPITDPAKITVDKLEMLSLAENMRRNSYHNKYPKEICRAIQLSGALTRQINKAQEMKP